jgi:hypothetical protein
VKALKTVNEHRAIGLIENVPTNLHYAIGPDPDEVPVERRVVKPAQSDTIWDDRRT